MEDIIDNVALSYRLLEDLVKYQIDYLINLLVGEWKTYAQWIWQNWEFETLNEFYARIRAHYADLYVEAMDEGAEEDATAAELEEEKDVNDFSTDEESHVDE